MKDNGFWDNIEDKLIETMRNETPFKESQIRLSLEQSKKTNMLGYTMKYARQKKRVSVKKIAGLLRVKESDIKKLESGNIEYFPLKFIINYLNWLGCALSFQITDLTQKRGKKNGT